MDDTELVEQSAEEIRSLGPLHLAITPMQAFRLVGLLQLASRHPGVSPDNHQAIRWFIEHVRLHFADCPAMLEIIERGDDPASDSSAVTRTGKR